MVIPTTVPSSSHPSLEEAIWMVVATHSSGANNLVGDGIGWKDLLPPPVDELLTDQIKRKWSGGEMGC